MSQENTVHTVQERQERRRGMKIIMIVAVLAILVLLLASWFISTQRRLVRIDENLTNALKQIDVQAQSRFDSLTAINHLVKRYDSHEAETLEKIISARSRGSGTAMAAEEMQTAFDTALGRINALVEQYPQLKADGNYQRAMAAVNEREDQVRTARMVYNDCATKLNRELRMFPTSLIAGMLGFSERGYLMMEAGKMGAVTME